MSIETLNLRPELYQYLLDVSIRENQILKDLRDETHKLTSYVMQIAPDAGQLMSLLVELINAKKTLDIGTFTGYSALVVALALPTDGIVHTCDIDPKNTKTAQYYWQKAGVSGKIKLHLAKASDTLQQFIDQGESETFDFAFIDADKNSYDDYYEKSLQLVRKGGLIAIDNVLWNGAVIDPDVNDNQTKAIRSLNKKLLNDDRITLSMLSIADGLTLAKKC